MRKSFALLFAALIMAAMLVGALSPVLADSMAENSWVSKAPMRQARSGLGVAAVNGKIYAIGGSAQSGFVPNAYGSIVYGTSAKGVATNEEYDPETDTWTYKTLMPTARLAFATAVYKDKIYCIGGQANGSFIGINEVYDPLTNMWETKAAMPTARGWLTANVVNGKIYLISGYGNSPGYSTVNEVYDPEINSWETSTPSPSNPIESYTSTSAVVDNRIYLIGGLSGYHNLNQIYDIQTNSWSSGKSPPSSISGVAAGSITGAFAPKRIYLIGNALMLWQGAPQYTNRVYDPKMNSWSTAKDMPSERFHFGIAVVNDTLYVIGGNTYTIPGNYAPLALNEQYIPLGYGTTDPSYIQPIESGQPKTSVLSPVNQTYTGSTVPLVFAVDKPVDWLGYSLNGAENVTISGNTTLTGLSSGSHNITVYAKDTFGNTGASETVTFTVNVPRSFPIVPVAASGAAIVLVVVAGVLYYRKRRQQVIEAKTLVKKV